MLPRDARAFKDRGEWRTWLRKNGRRSSGIWLLIHKKGSKREGIRHLEALDEALCFGWIDSQLMSVDADTFALRFTPRKKNCIWSESNKRRALELIKQGRMTSAGMEKIDEDKRCGSWEAALTARKEVDVPADLMNALKRDPDALKGFRELSNSHKLQYVFWIGQAKRPATRKRRIEETVRRVVQE